MAEKSYHILEIVGSSKSSIEDAIQGAITDASKNARTLRWFEVVETRGYIDANKVAYFQVTLKIGYENS